MPSPAASDGGDFPEYSVFQLPVGLACSHGTPLPCGKTPGDSDTATEYRGYRQLKRYTLCKRKGRERRHRRSRPCLGWPVYGLGVVAGNTPTLSKVTCINEPGFLLVTARPTKAFACIVNVCAGVVE